MKWFWKKNDIDKIAKSFSVKRKYKFIPFLRESDEKLRLRTRDAFKNRNINNPLGKNYSI